MVDNKEDEDAGAAAAEAVSPDPDMEDSTEEEETADESSSEEDSSSSDEDHMANVQRPEETLLQGRSRRKTAGTRMAALLNDEEDEEFYKTTYGDEVFRDSNSDFEVSEEESWDELDTDFDDDEVEQETQVVEPTEELKKKRKVYTDPLKNLHKRRKVAPAGSKAPARGKATKSTPRPRSTRSAIQDSADIRKSSRKGTVTKTKDFEGRAKDRDEHSRRKSITRKPRVPEKKMTQAERLREAVKTEHLNALSLLRFRQKEAKAKKTVLRKTTFKGPTGTGSNADQGNADAASAVLVGGPEPQHRKRRSIIEKAKKHTLTSNLILNDIYQEVVVQDNEDGVTDDDFFKGILEPDLCDTPQEQGVASNIGDRFSMKHGETAKQHTTLAFTEEMTHQVMRADPALKK
eukprot:gene20497-9784_t